MLARAAARARALLRAPALSAAAPRARAAAAPLLSAPARTAATTPAPTEFASEAAYAAALESRAALPAGFSVGTSSFQFAPPELPGKTAAMTVTMIKLDAPSRSVAALFTRSAFPGAPVLVGRARFAAREPELQAVVINNKVSNVCAPGGVAASEAVCAAAARALGLARADLVLPCSTGVIGWRLPERALVDALPAAAATLQRASVLPAARGICTTDLYAKVRTEVLPGGARVVGIAKGAGMVEPGLATMLVYVLTDAVVPPAELRAALVDAVEPSFNSISIDTDMSTSECVAAGAREASTRAARGALTLPFPPPAAPSSRSPPTRSRCRRARAPRRSARRSRACASRSRRTLCATARAWRT